MAKYVLFFFFFFFFKQKTAYELSVRDWSSDVCSSDLCELALLFSEPGVEDHLEEEVAQFLLQRSAMAGLDRFQDFVRFFDQVRLQRCPRLHTIPRAAVGCTQAHHDVQEPFKENAGGLDHVGS